MGAGSLGPVFRGEDPLNRTSVAVKVIDVGLQPPQLHAVVDALSALVETFPSHPSLAAPLAAGLADGAPYVVWPLLDGDSLGFLPRRILVEEGRAEQVRRLLIAAGLEHELKSE